MIGLMKGWLPAAILVMLSAMSVPQVDEPVVGQGSEWNIKIVDFVGERGGLSSLALDSRNYPHMSYTDSPNRDIKYAKWTGSEWSIDIIDSVTGCAGHSSLALDSTDYPHLAYYDDFHGAMKYATRDGGTWINESIDTTYRIKGGESLVLDESNYPRMSYNVNYEPPDPDASALRFASWNGSDWKFENIDYVPLFMGGTSLSLDSNYYPHIAYTIHGGDMDLRYAKWNGSAWNIEVVDYAGNVGAFPSLAIDGNDYAHIAYRDYSHGDLKYARWDGGKWNIEKVDYVGDVGWFASLALDSDDDPHIAYYDSTKLDLKYAEWTASGWSIETVDSEGWVGEGSSLALDTDDKPHISYFDGTNANLKYATKAELAPPSRTISLDIDPNTLNLKSRGRWITADLSAENASVHDIDVSSILLQDALAPERWDYQDDVLMLKFNRQELIAVLEVGESVEIKLSGKWKDGTDFEAYDYIRVIDPGRWIEFPWISRRNVYVPSQLGNTESPATSSS